MTLATDLQALVNRKERTYYFLIVAYGVLLYVLFGFGSAAVHFLVPVPPGAEGGGIATIVGYVVAFSLTFFVIHGIWIGHLRGNGIRASERQFPELMQMATRHAATLGLRRVPDVFVLQSGGVLNAFAKRFLGRDFVVIYTDVLALAERRGEGAVSFIVAHELAHVQRGHLKHRWLTGPGRMVPFLGSAYSRACEYTCDRLGAHCEPDGAIDGLLVLAAGRDLYHRVSVRDFKRQSVTDGGFWFRCAELVASHPHLANRVDALLAAGVSMPAVTGPAASPFRGAAPGMAAPAMAS